ncbi:MAG: oxalate/formate MFS antiporter [Acidisphaera sp.]|nr:oxalate/formate MFS antiporter [Acidisphaera sp.]
MNDTNPAKPAVGRWGQLWLGVLCMVLIANLQYAWTLFVSPMHQAHGWAIADIQLAFSIFIATETWATPIEGWIVDRLGPRRGPKLMVTFGAVLVAIGWIINARTGTLSLLYLGAALSGIGAGAVYATCVGNAVKWFPDRRGLAVGLTAGGFGAGAALTVIPIRLTIEQFGYAPAFFWFGLAQGGILLIVGRLLAAPAGASAPLRVSARLRQTTRSATPGQVLRTPTFWVLYVMLVLVSASGLMATAQLAPIARDFGIANTPLFFGATTIAVALVVDNVMNGMARPAFGWLSDRIGREQTMALAFALGGASYWLLGTLGTRPWAFVICAGLIFFTWGEIFSLFPSTCTDTFGPTYATANASLLYTAKGTSAWLVPLANLLQVASGGWHAVFVVAAAMNFLVAFSALAVLRPIRTRQLRLTLAAEDSAAMPTGELPPRTA